MLQSLHVFDPIVVFLEFLHFTDQNHNILIAKCNILMLNYCEFHRDFVNKTNCLLFDPTFCTRYEARGF